MDRLTLTMGKDKLGLVVWDEAAQAASLVVFPRMEVIRLIHLLTYALMKGEGYKANMNVKEK